MKTVSHTEADLFEPVKNLFLKEGFAGDGEVGSIDLYMEKDGLSAAVELKKTLDLKAIEQAAVDQKTCDLVYIGIFRPKNLCTRANKDKIYLLKRLGIGLILVSERTMTAQLYSEPVVSELSAFQKNHRKKTAEIKKEFRERKLKENTGGVNRTKRMTAYREESLIVLYHLKELGGQAAPKTLRERTGISKTAGILYHNFYGWFEHAGKGIYRIRSEGAGALEEYEKEIGKLVSDFQTESLKQKGEKAV